MPAVYVVATFNLNPENVDEGKALILGFVEPSRAQQGCLFYEVHQSTDDPTEFVVLDGWANVDDLDAHATSEQVVRTVNRLNPILTKPAQVKTYLKIS
jgi:quinol monooxygenase YgiN